MSDINDIKLNLETIEDFVLNQDKIVTYRWLSRELIVHTNTAKQLLYTFALKNAEKGLLVTYIICGTTEDGGIDISVVNQSNIDKVKSELSSILSEHVYSVQKSTASISSTDLYLADISSTPSCDNRSAIATRNVETRSFEYVKLASNKPTNPQPTTDNKKNGPVDSNQEKNLKPAKEESTKENVSKTGTKTSKVVSPIKNSKKAVEGSIDNIFNKQNQQNAEKKKKDEKVGQNTSKDQKQAKVVSPVKNLKKKIEGSLTALFSKQNAMKNDKKKSELPPKVVEPVQVPPSEDVEEAPAVEDDCNPKKTAVKTPLQGKKTKSSTGNKKRKTTNDNDNPAKKRKRIVLASDSDSGEDEEMEVTEEPESEPESHPIQEKVSDSEDEVIPPTPYGERTKKRVRKQIDKTYTDDDGFVITEKEFVYESCSDDEDNKQPNKDEKTNIDSTTPKRSNSNKENIKAHKDVDSNVNDDDNSTKEQLNDSGDKKLAKNDNENESEEVSTKGKGKQGKKSTRGKGKSPKNTSSTNNKQASIMSFFKKV